MRWVSQYKWEIPTKDATASGSHRAEAKPERNIRARLTVRGFKDSDKADIDRYAGTSSKCSQKLLVSEAVRNQWLVFTADISKAFLQGVTYEELAQLTGNPVREVNFYSPQTTYHCCRNFQALRPLIRKTKSYTATSQAPDSPMHHERSPSN